MSTIISTKSQQRTGCVEIDDFAFIRWHPPAVEIDGAPADHRAFHREMVSFGTLEFGEVLSCEFVDCGNSSFAETNFRRANNLEVKG